MQNLKRGILIAIEGIDGAGKTVLTDNLATVLKKEGFPVLATREPGGTALGQQIRTILHNKPKTTDPKAEYLLFAADRAQHFEEFIIPNLEANKLIITDRCGDSSLVYQGFAHDLDLDTIMLVNRWAMNHYEPDLVCYIRVDAKTAQERVKHRGIDISAFEKESESFFTLLVKGFDSIFHERPHVITLDGKQSPETITTQAQEAIVEWITQNSIL